MAINHTTIETNNAITDAITDLEEVLSNERANYEWDTEYPVDEQAFGRLAALVGEREARDYARRYTASLA